MRLSSEGWAVAIVGGLARAFVSAFRTGAGAVEIVASDAPLGESGGAPITGVRLLGLSPSPPPCPLAGHHARPPQASLLGGVLASV